MKIKQYSWYVLLSMALLLVGLSACETENKQPIEARFKVSLTNILFNKDGGSEVITVSGVNQWNYISNIGEDAWLSLSKEGDKLTLTATNNPSGQERKAEVLITSRFGTQKVYVVQSASDMVLNFSESELVFSHKAEEKIVQVATNSNTWAFEPLTEDVKSWLTIVATPGAKTIILKVAENKTYEVRTATLIAKGQNGEKVGLKVTQNGVAKYILPYEPQDKNYKDIDLITFEQNRGSILQGYQEAKWDYVYKEEVPGVAQFLTTSDYMPIIAYKRDLGELKYTMAQSILYINDDVEQVELKEYDAFLKENGYIKEDAESTELLWYYVNEKRAMLAEIHIQQGGAIVAFAPLYPQTEAYPTFPKVPTDREGWLEKLANPQVKVEDIIKMEKDNGSELTFQNKDDATQMTKGMGFLCAKSDDKYASLNHTYWCYTSAPKNVANPDEYIQSVSEQAMYFSNPTWGIRQEGRKYYVTNEFDDLLLKDGYQYDGTDKVGETFYYVKQVNETKLLALYVKQVHYTDVNDGKKALMIGYFPVFQSAQSNATLNAQAQSAMRAAKEGNFEALDYLFSSKVARIHDQVNATHSAGRGVRK